MEYEIYFSDLNEETQKELLELMKIKDPKEMNWDVFPITSCIIGEEDD